MHIEKGAVSLGSFFALHFLRNYRAHFHTNLSLHIKLLQLGKLLFDV